MVHWQLASLPFRIESEYHPGERAEHSSYGGKRRCWHLGRYHCPRLPGHLWPLQRAAVGTVIRKLVDTHGIVGLNLHSAVRYGQELGIGDVAARSCAPCRRCWEQPSPANFRTWRRLSLHRSHGSSGLVKAGVPRCSTALSDNVSPSVTESAPSAEHTSVPMVVQSRSSTPRSTWPQSEAARSARTSWPVCGVALERLYGRTRSPAL